MIRISASSMHSLYVGYKDFSLSFIYRSDGDAVVQQLALSLYCNEFVLSKMCLKAPDEIVLS